MLSEVTNEAIVAVADYIGCGAPLAQELVTLAGGDAQLVIDCAFQSGSLSMTKARILDARINNACK